jgi:hypothetical protein
MAVKRAATRRKSGFGSMLSIKGDQTDQSQSRPNGHERVLDRAPSEVFLGIHRGEGPACPA